MLTTRSVSGDNQLLKHQHMTYKKNESDHEINKTDLVLLYKLFLK